MWQDVLVPVNYLLAGFGCRATTGSNSRYWQVGGGTLKDTERGKGIKV